MKTRLEQFEKWLKSPEDIDLEFKAASHNFDSSRGSLNDCCAAISNGRGGKLILGVSDDKGIHGTTIFQGTYPQQSHKLWEHLKIHIDVEEFFYQEKRTLIFHIPKHPVGMRVKSGGKGDKFTYPIRRGESLGEMDDHKTREILNETQPDFTATIVEGFTVGDLDQEAVTSVRREWAEKKKRPEVLSFSTTKILDHLHLIDGCQLNYACLILLGKKAALDRLLPNSEIIFEWRMTAGQTYHDFRSCWREPYFNIHNVVWEKINARNSRIPYQDGLFQKEVQAFDEKSIREALLNAITHRDYTIRGQSVFIIADPKAITTESPGGFLPGITPENIIDKRAWRNRRLAEAFEKVGLIERSGQGMNDIFEHCIRDGKGLPDLSKSDPFSVVIKIPAQVQDKSFVFFLEKISKEKQMHLDVHEVLELERVRCGQAMINIDLKKKFLQAGIIEPVGKTRGIKYILARRYYETIGQSGKHTRLKGLHRNQVKELILNHIREGKPSRREDFLSGLPEYRPQDISNILQELKSEGKLIFKGAKKGGAWHVSN